MPTTLPEGRLHLLFQPTDEEVYEPDFLLETPLIRFVAYAANQRVFGWVSLAAERLTDLLNSCDELHLEDVKLAGFDNGAVTFADEVHIGRADLVAVHASGPRGDETQRQRTHLHPLAIQAGNYLIAGHLHVAPGLDPMDALAGRPCMVPLTDGWIEYWIGDERRYRATGSFIVNRDRADWIGLLAERDLVSGRLRPGHAP